MIETGKILQQRYRIDKQIGQGGMGAVYVATDERFGSVVAIKETLLMDDSYRKAIEREARLLNSLKHQALPRVSDHFLEENGQFLVMEFIPGEDLGHTLERDRKAFPVDTVLDWADQLLDALEFLHTQSIPVIHRDIKPQNLKINSRDQIILLDFGLAKGNPTDAGHNTAAKSIFGYSRSYASLEQIQGTGTDPRSDLYSLAATLYHLLTAEPPVDALTRAMAVLSKLPDPLKPANKLNAAVPPGVAGVLQCSMDLNAASRPASAAEMRRMLRESEQYAAYADVDNDASAIVAPSAEPTKLMPETTRRDAQSATDVRTLLHPGRDAEETRIRSNSPVAFVSTTGKVQRRRLPSALMAAAGAILLVCIATLGAYLYKPEVFQHGVSSQAENVSSNAANDHSANTAEGAQVSNHEASPDESMAGERSKTPQPARTEADRSTKTAAREKPSTAEDGDPNDQTIYVGNMRIRNGRVETPDSIIDENGIRPRNPKIPQVPGFPPGLTREQIRQMTPEQRRRIRKIYIRNQAPNYPIPPDQ
jgi:serine/threonine protein kinase